MIAVGKGPGLKYGFFPRIIQTKIFWKNNLEGSQKGLAKYGGRGPKIAFVINGQSSNFCFCLAVKFPRFRRYMALSRPISRDLWCVLGQNGPP